MLEHERRDDTHVRSGAWEGDVMTAQTRAQSRTITLLLHRLPCLYG